MPGESSRGQVPAHHLHPSRSSSEAKAATALNRMRRAVRIFATSFDEFADALLTTWRRPDEPGPILQPRLLTVDQAAEYLAVSSDTVRRLLRERKLPTIHLKSSVRIPLDGLDQWVSDSIEHPTEPWRAPSLRLGRRD